MDFKNMVTKEIDSIIESGIVESAIQKELQETMSEIIHDTLREYSDFGKKLKDEVKKVVDINFSELTIPTYNKLIVNTIKEGLDKLMMSEGVAKLKADMENMLLGETKDWKLSELMKNFKEENEDDARQNDWSEISFHCEYDGTFAHIYFDAEPDKLAYECSNKLFIYKDELSSVNFKESHKLKDLSVNFVGKLYGFEKLIFQIYARGSKIIIDDDKVDTYYPSEYY